MVVESAEFMLNKSGCHSIVEGILINIYTDPFIITKVAVVGVIFYVYLLVGLDSAVLNLMFNFFYEINILFTLLDLPNNPITYFLN